MGTSCVIIFSVQLDMLTSISHISTTLKKKLQDHVQAQIDLIDEVLKWSYGSDNLGSRSPKTVVDVGCGIGGSSRHIVKKYPGSTAQGITLSPYQANRGNEVRLF